MREVVTLKEYYISIHALRVEGDVIYIFIFVFVPSISIHALRVEGDERRFLHSARYADFYPRPPGGGRLSHSMFPRTAETISIHALRVEGDKIAPFVKHLHYISIHALRVEGDEFPEENIEE